MKPLAKRTTRDVEAPQAIIRDVEIDYPGTGRREDLFGGLPGVSPGNDWGRVTVTLSASPAMIALLLEHLRSQEPIAANALHDDPPALPAGPVVHEAVFDEEENP